MATRPPLSMALIGLGVILLIVGVIPVGGSFDGDYLHRVDPARNGTLAHGLEYEENDVLAYDNLSERGQAVFDHGLNDSPNLVENESATATDFTYTSDAVVVGNGLYPIRYSGDIYSLQNGTTKFRAQCR